MIGLRRSLGAASVDPSLKLELKFNQNVYTDLAATAAAGLNDYIRAWRSTVNNHLFTQAADAARPQRATDGLYFDGGDWVTGADSTDFNLGVGGTPFTLLVKVYLSSLNQFVAVSRGSTVDDWNSTTGNQYWLYWYHPTNALYWRWWTGSAMGQLVISSVGFTTGTFYTIEVGYDGTTTRIWIDGVYKGNTTGSYAKPSGATGLKIGVAPLNNYNLAGKIDFLKIYNTALHTSNANY